MVQTCSSPGVGCIGGVIVLGGREVDMIRVVLQHHPQDGGMDNDFVRQWHG